MKNEIKAIFFDIDGTLVPFGERCAPDSVKNCLAQLREKGIKVFVSSGRYISWIDNLDGIDFDGYVTANGAMCYLSDRKTCFFKRTIPAVDIKNLAEYTRDTEIVFAVIPTDGKAFATGENRELLQTYKLLNIPNLPIRQLHDTDGLEIVQLMAFGSEALRNDPDLFSRVLTDCEPTSWNPLFCDIVPKGSDKSKGIVEMMRHFGIDIAETMAFGDGENDIAMLRRCGIGVAMGNAPEAVREAADYVTTADRDNGIENALRHFSLL